MHFITQINESPEVGSKVTIIHLFMGFVLGAVKQFSFIQNGRISPLVMDCFQMGAWAIAIIVGLFTIIGYGKKWSAKNKDGGKNDKND